MLKRCCTCREKLPLVMFCKNRSSKDGLQHNCRQCKAIQAKRERERHKEAIAARDKEYRTRNQEKIATTKHKYYLKNKDAINARINAYIAHNRDKHNAWRTKSKNKLKTEVFLHYCGNKLKCQHCNESYLGLLSIDHINGDGARHRKEIGLEGGGGYAMYQWIKRNNYPDTFQVLCLNCQFRKRSTEMGSKNPTHTQQVVAAYVRSIKLECLQHYGGCRCPCGEDDFRVLTLDHVNDDGADHRRRLGTSGFGFYMYLRKNGFPNNPPLQVLCVNCNWQKR